MAARRNAHGAHGAAVRGVRRKSAGQRRRLSGSGLCRAWSPLLESLRKRHCGGNHPGNHKEQFIRATLESIAYQVHDVVQAMEEDAKVSLTALKVDGGASANDLLLQFQADINEAAVCRPECIETTALGAAYLAGLATGFWKDKEEIRRNWKLNREFVPGMSAEARKEKLKGWKRAVRCALAWAEDEE